MAVEVAYYLHDIPYKSISYISSLYLYDRQEHVPGVVMVKTCNALIVLLVTVRVFVWSMY